MFVLFAALRRLVCAAGFGSFESAASTRLCGQLVRLAGFAALSGVGALVCFERWPKVSVSMFTAFKVSHGLGTRLKSKIGKPKLWETREIGKVLRLALSVSRALVERANGCRRAEVEVAAAVGPRTNIVIKSRRTNTHIATMAQVARCVE